jgi:hypothetical protein
VGFNNRTWKYTVPVCDSIDNLTRKKNITVPETHEALESQPGVDRSNVRDADNSSLDGHQAAKLRGAQAAQWCHALGQLYSRAHSREVGRFHNCAAVVSFLGLCRGFLPGFRIRLLNAVSSCLLPADPGSVSFQCQTKNWKKLNRTKKFKLTNFLISNFFQIFLFFITITTTKDF